MNTPTSDLAALLAPATHVLLDFDGPVCDMFAGLPAADVADVLRQLVIHTGTALPAEVGTTQDPLAVLRASTGHAAAIIEQALQAAETQAAATALPTPGAHELLAACADTGRRVMIVSNNSANAITAYLQRSGLARYVTSVVGRHPGDPSLMKPAPFLLLQALREADAPTAVFVGDSISDVQAGTAARVPVIGYANKPGKHERLRNAGAQAITDSMAALADAMLSEAPTVARPGPP